MRKLKFQNDHYYHIYNRGVDKREIFSDEKDYIRFLLGMREFNQIETIGSLYKLKHLRKKKNKEYRESKSPIGDLDSREKLVEIICSCLLPNHYHFILKQLTENGIMRFMHKLGLGYTMYFNFKNNRSGVLFQGRYKSIHIKSDSYLNYLSAYIHGNPEIHKIKKVEDWKWSSYLDYSGRRRGTLSNKKVILDEFKNIQDYKDYVDSVIRESGQRKDEIKNYFLE